MGKGVSLHIGVNKLQIGIYDAEGVLCSPANDAQMMASIAKAEGFENVCLLLNREATKSKFLEHFDRCIQELKEGDTFLLTFSGHGGQIDDVDDDEQDGKDEVWCFYDNYLVDDDLGKKWREFKKGVRIIVVSASCHSRSALRVWVAKTAKNRSTHERIFREEIRQNDKSILQSYINDPDIGASILHISACEDEQEARDGDQFSRFTGVLVKHWNNGNFTGTYEELVKNIRRDAGYSQRAGIATLGVNDQGLLNSIPFKLLTIK